MSLSALADATGTYRSAGLTPANSDTDLSIVLLSGNRQLRISGSFRESRRATRHRTASTERRRHGRISNRRQPHRTGSGHQGLQHHEKFLTPPTANSVIRGAFRLESKELTGYRSLPHRTVVLSAFHPPYHCVHHPPLDRRRRNISGRRVLTALLSAATIARVRTFAFSGIEAVPVEVQVQISGGTPALLLVGLPDKAVGEARERMRAALSAMGLSLPPRRVLINLAPADLLKEGSHFDLPIALGRAGGDGRGAARGPVRLRRARRTVAGRHAEPGGRRAAGGDRRLDAGPRADLPGEPGRRGGVGGPDRGAGGRPTCCR